MKDYSYHQNVTMDVYCIFATADPSVTSLSLVMHRCKPEYPAKGLDCCVQGQSHRNGSNVGSECSA